MEPVIKTKNVGRAESILCSIIDIILIIFACLGRHMVIGLDSKQVVSFEELLMSKVVQQEAITRLLVEKGMLTKEELLEIVRVVNQETKR